MDATFSSSADLEMLSYLTAENDSTEDIQINKLCNKLSSQLKSAHSSKKSLMKHDIKDFEAKRRKTFSKNTIDLKNISTDERYTTVDPKNDFETRSKRIMRARRCKTDLENISTDETRSKRIKRAKIRKTFSRTTTTDLENISTDEIYTSSADLEMLSYLTAENDSTEDIQINKLCNMLSSRPNSAHSSKKSLMKHNIKAFKAKRCKTFSKKTTDLENISTDERYGTDDPKNDLTNIESPMIVIIKQEVTEPEQEYETKSDLMSVEVKQEPGTVENNSVKLEVIDQEISSFQNNGENCMESSQIVWGCPDFSQRSHVDAVKATTPTTFNSGVEADYQICLNYVSGPVHNGSFEEIACVSTKQDKQLLVAHTEDTIDKKPCLQDSAVSDGVLSGNLPSIVKVEVDEEYLLESSLELMSSSEKLANFPVLKVSSDIISNEPLLPSLNHKNSQENNHQSIPFTSTSKNSSVPNISSKDSYCHVCCQRFVAMNHRPGKELAFLCKGQMIVFKICGQCDSEIVQLKYLTVDIESLDRVKLDYKCNVCMRRFRRKSHLWSHVIKHNFEDRKLCGLCEKMCTSENEFKAHKLSHEDKIAVLSCMRCKIDFTSIEFFFKHECVQIVRNRFPCNRSNLQSSSSKHETPSPGIEHFSVAGICDYEAQSVSQEKDVISGKFDGKQSASLCVQKEKNATVSVKCGDTELASPQTCYSKNLFFAATNIKEERVEEFTQRNSMNKPSCSSKSQQQSSTKDTELPSLQTHYLENPFSATANIKKENVERVEEFNQRNSINKPNYFSVSQQQSSKTNIKNFLYLSTNRNPTTMSSIDNDKSTTNESLLIKKLDNPEKSNPIKNKSKPRNITATKTRRNSKNVNKLYMNILNLIRLSSKRLIGTYKAKVQRDVDKKMCETEQSKRSSERIQSSPISEESFTSDNNSPPISKRRKVDATTAKQSSVKRTKHRKKSLKSRHISNLIFSQCEDITPNAYSHAVLEDGVIEQSSVVIRRHKLKDANFKSSINRVPQPPETGESHLENIERLKSLPVQSNMEKKRISF